MSFEGVRHGEIVKLVHDNPEQFYPLFMGGCFVGKPRPKEDLCREILLHLGYSMVEITRLHLCDFNMVAYKKLSAGSMEEKVDDVSKSVIKKERVRSMSSSRISIPSEGLRRSSSLRDSTCHAYSPDDRGSSLPPSAVVSQQAGSPLNSTSLRLTLSTSDISRVPHSEELQRVKSHPLSRSTSHLRQTGYSGAGSSRDEADKLDDKIDDEVVTSATQGEEQDLESKPKIEAVDIVAVTSESDSEPVFQAADSKDSFSKHDDALQFQFD